MQFLQLARRVLKSLALLPKRGHNSPKRNKSARQAVHTCTREKKTLGMRPAMFRPADGAPWGDICMWCSLCGAGKLVYGSDGHSVLILLLLSRVVMLIVCSCLCWSLRVINVMMEDRRELFLLKPVVTFSCFLFPIVVLQENPRTGVIQKISSWNFKYKYNLWLVKLSKTFIFYLL